MPAVKIVVSILLLMVVTTFSVQNIGSVEVKYYDLLFHVHSVEIPLLVIILSSLMAGFVLAWVAGIFKQFKLKALLRQSNRTIRSMSSELERMKTR